MYLCFKEKTNEQFKQYVVYCLVLICTIYTTIQNFKGKLLNTSFLGSGVLFIMLFNEVLTFESVNEILKCTCLNETELLCCMLKQWAFPLFKAVF